MTTFVLMYHPQLDNRQAEVPLQSVDDHASRGWLLVDGSTPTPSSPFLTPTAGDARYLRADDVDDPGTPTGGALRAASVAAVAKARLWDDFTDVANGAKPTTAASGQTWGRREAEGVFTVTDGKLGLASGNAAYLEAQLDGPVSRLGSEVIFDDEGGARTTNGGVNAMVAWNDGGVAANGLGRRSRCHLTFGPDQLALWVRETVNGPLTGPIWSTSYATPLAKDGVTRHRAEAYLRDDTVALVLPNGEIAVYTDSRLRGADPFACFEPFYNAPATDARVYITRVWADSGNDPAETANGAALRALAAAGRTPKRTAAVAQLTSGLALTGTYTDIDATKFATSFIATGTDVLFDVELPVTMTAVDSIWLQVRLAAGGNLANARATWTQVSGPLRKRLRYTGLVPGRRYSVVLQAKVEAVGGGAATGTATVNQSRDGFFIAEPLAP